MFMILAILTIATCTYRIQMREVGLSGPSSGPGWTTVLYLGVGSLVSFKRLDHLVADLGSGEVLAEEFKELTLFVDQVEEDGVVYQVVVVCSRGRKTR
jgi:hypothetical protein